MPREIRDKKQLESLLPSASQLIVVRRDEGVRLKLRTKRFLYTFKTTEEEVDSLIKGTKVEVVEY